MFFYAHFYVPWMVYVHGIFIPKIRQEVEQMKTRTVLMAYEGSEKEEVFIVELQEWKGNIA